jgi:hypothetical protein
MSFFWPISFWLLFMVSILSIIVASRFIMYNSILRGLACRMHAYRGFVADMYRALHTIIRAVRTSFLSHVSIDTIDCAFSRWEALWYAHMSCTTARQFHMARMCILPLLAKCIHIVFMTSNLQDWLQHKSTTSVRLDVLLSTSKTCK